MYKQLVYLYLALVGGRYVEAFTGPQQVAHVSCCGCRPPRHVVLEGSKESRNQVIGTELFPEAGTSYVPYGLTPEEYAKIKKAESDSAKKKNYGAWGPKFGGKAGKAPEGDWMVMPSLWTSGYSAGQSNQSKKVQKGFNDDNNKMDSKSPVILVRLVSFILIDMLSTILYLWNRNMVPSILACTISMFKLPAKRDMMPFSAPFALVTSIKLLSAFALSARLKGFVERCSRSFNMSQKRFIGVGFILSILSNLLVLPFCLKGLH